MRDKFAFSTSQVLVIFVALWLAPECFAGKVQVWMDKSTDFSAYKTYRWLPPKLLTKTGLVDDNAEFAAIVKEAINRELARKGLTEVTEGADLEVSTLALTQPIPQLEGFIFPGATPDFFTAPVATMGRYTMKERW